MTAEMATENAKKVNSTREEKKAKVAQNYINAKIRKAVKQGKGGVIINRKGLFGNRFDPDNLKIEWLLNLGYDCEYCDIFDVLAIYWKGIKI